MAGKLPDRPRNAEGERQSFFDRAAPRWDERRDPGAEGRLASLVERMGLGAGERVLDVGAGTGVLTLHLWEALGGEGTVVAIDFSFPMLRQMAAKGVKALLVQASVLALPFREGSFDYCVCNAVFPHFPGKAPALAELFRALSPGGGLAISHATGRRQVNQRHRARGGTIAGDVLPEESEMQRLLSGAGFQEVRIWEEEDRYLALARRGS